MDNSNINNMIFDNDDRFIFIKTKLINTMFPILDENDKKLLLKSLAKIINYIHIKFNLSNNTDNFWNQLIQNDLLDLRALVGIMLPYIMDNDKDDNKHSLKKLADIFLEVDPKTDKYKYSNMQYNRCIRSDDKITKRPLSNEDFENHIRLLMMSIEQCSNKLHINWIDVLPITMNEYKNMDIYRQTVDNFMTKIVKPDVISYYYDDKGLSYQDMYNVLVNYLYHEIVDYKWLIYEIKNNNSTSTIISYLEQNNIFNVDLFWKNIKWSQLSKSEHVQFVSDWNSLLNKNDKYSDKIIYNINNFFMKHHVNINRIIKKYLLEDFPKKDDEKEDGEDAIDPSMEKINISFSNMKKVPIDEIYLFLYHQLSAFKRSWYYYAYKVKNITFYEDSTGRATIKNVYNYAKLIASTTENDVFYMLPNMWQSLLPEHIKTVTNKIYDVNNSSYWFNISRYFRYFYGITDQVKLKDQNTIVHNIIRNNLVDIIFEAMIYHGILSQYVPNSKITDLNKIMQTTRSTDYGNIIQEQKNQVKNVNLTANKRLSYENHGYYFLTGTTYGELGLIKNKEYEKKYFDWLADNTDWHFRYAMNWVSQINFYHHFANTRVMYLTGATGTGKSTIIPRLLTYGNHMINYNIVGKIICTQPRISPTVENATTIALESGVPIKEYNKEYGLDFPTNNYYIQYKHSNDDHMDKNQPSFLRIVTDGTLLSDIKKYPFLTKTNPNKTLSNKNIYDILIVDEAHEHNTNMDIILTLARDACYINNSIKIVIISATMNDDEPIYRRYYRSINDNRMYPNNQFISTMKIDRAIMDRRVDISIPRKTTQYDITDVFLSKSESNKIDKKNFVVEGIKKTIQVIKSTTEGDILLFLTGKKDINMAVDVINSDPTIPLNVICFPFVSAELSDEERDFIIKIDKTLKTYTRYKMDRELEENQITRRVPIGTYTRAIIVATNVAEASISLRNLKYVIDTGYAKVDIYYPLKGVTKLITLQISETSRVQRRGRVGRVATGTVYYMYDEDKVANIKTAYKISDSDIKDTIIDLMRSDLNDIPIINSNNDPNNISLIKKSYRNIKEINVIKSIINKYYRYIPDGLFYDYYGVDSCDDYEYQKYNFSFVSRSLTGFSSETLKDNNLSFYVIHPDENIINRNMYKGTFIGPKYSDAIDSEYYYYFFKKNKIDVEMIYDYKMINKDLNTYIFPKFDIMVDDGKKLMRLIEIENELIKTSFAQKIKRISEIVNIDILKDPYNILWYMYTLP